VLGLACVLFCNECDAATAHAERGWRAYVSPDRDCEPAIIVMCPDCAEEHVGEDETAWSQ
jgi:hypothetical protein